MNKYQVHIKGETPLLMHAHNIAWLEAMRQWGMDPGNKKNSVAGDDRTPAHRWIGCLYIDGGMVCMPSDNLMSMLREGGKRCPTGKGKGTYMRQSQSGLVVDQSSWVLEGACGTIKWSDIEPLTREPDFTKHEAHARELGFELFAKGVKIGKARHIRVRPRFDRWACAGTITVLDDTITEGVLRNILTFAGAYSGLGDWRPSSESKPGSFGKFTVTMEALR